MSLAWIAEKAAAIVIAELENLGETERDSSKRVAGEGGGGR